MSISFSKPQTSVRIALNDQNGTLQISIENEGPSIDPENLEDIFNLFYSQRPKNHGAKTHSGLGLSISKQIVQAHNGDIRAENIYSNDGSPRAVCFTISLPKAQV